MAGELAIALTTALSLAAVAAVVLAVRTRRVVATPTERAVHAALHTASLAARALRQGLDTSGSFVGGLMAEQALVTAMTGAGAPAALTTSGALLAALRYLGISRIATATPYTADLTVGLTAFLGEAGVEVTAATGLGLISDIWTVPHDVTAQLVRDTDNDHAQAVFISCTNMPTYDVIARLEAELRKPVLTANQVTMWLALNLIGRKAVGPGQQLMER